MAKNTVLIGCKLPNGIILQHPFNPRETVEINGLNKPTIIGATYVTTEVDADFWANWLAVHEDYAPIASGAIFVAKNAERLEAIAREQVSRKTGFEGMDQNAGGVQATDQG